MAKNPATDRPAQRPVATTDPATAAKPAPVPPPAPRAPLGKLPKR